MPALRLPLLLLLALTLPACAGEEEAASGRAGSEAALEYAPAKGYAPSAPEAAVGDVAALRTGAPATPQSTDTAAVPLQIIRTGHAQVEVEDLDPAVERLRALTARLGGYVANVQMQADPDRTREATLQLRIPAGRFDAALAGLDAVGEVESVDVTAEDVTEQYVDLLARLENARRLEARLVDLLERRTGSLQDVLAVERELARVREEIERIEGQLRVLRNRVAMSTLTVNVHEPVPVTGGRAGDVFRSALRQALRNFVGLVAGTIAALGIVVPLLVALALVVWGLRAVRRRRGTGPKE